MRDSGRPVTAFACIAFAFAACIEQARLLNDLVSRYVNEDHTLMWLMAEDWAHLRVHEPTFYGQPYGVTFEAIPTALLHALGTPYNFALPSALMSMALAAWWCLAFAAWRREQWSAALLAAAAPLLINIDHWVVVSVIGTGVGRLLAAVCAAICVGAVASPRNLSVALTLGGLGVLFDSAAAPLVAPALVWALLPIARQRRYWLPLLLGLIVPAAWYVFNIWFETAHPEHALHGSWGFSPELQTLRSNWDNPDRLFAPHTLELYRSSRLYVWLALCLLAVAAAARAWRELAAVSCLIALYAVLASLPKSLDGRETLWFPSARMTLVAPMAFWFATSVTFRAVMARARAAFGPRHLRALSIGGAALILIVGIGTFAVRFSSWTPRLDAISETGRADRALILRRAPEVYSLCEEVAATARATQTTIIVFPTDRTADYACAALHPELLTVFPAYERRVWVLRRLSSKPADRMLVWWGLPTKDCKKKRFQSFIEACTVVADDRAIHVRFPPRPPLDVARDMGLKPRPFGPGCRPSEVATCGWWAERFGG